MIETDEAIHSPNRLQICAYLNWVDRAEFAVLRDMLGVADSVLSKHLAVLRTSEYVTTTRSDALGQRRTWVALTDAGRTAYARHVEALQRIIATPPLADAAGARSEV